MLVRNVEKKENNTATFQVEVDPAEFDKAINWKVDRSKKTKVAFAEKTTFFHVPDPPVRNHF